MHKTRSMPQDKIDKHHAMHKKKREDMHIRLHISKIIKYTMEYIKQKTQRALIFASKCSPTRCIPRKFLPTIDDVHLLSTKSHPQDRAMNPQGWVLGQV
jgi:hypothetical protein